MVKIIKLFLYHLQEIYLTGTFCPFACSFKMSEKNLEIIKTSRKVLLDVTIQLCGLYRLPSNDMLLVTLSIRLNINTGKGGCVRTSSTTLRLFSVSQSISMTIVQMLEKKKNQLGLIGKCKLKPVKSYLYTIHTTWYQLTFLLLLSTYLAHLFL